MTNEQKYDPAAVQRLVEAARAGKNKMLVTCKEYDELTAALSAIDQPASEPVAPPAPPAMESAESVAERITSVFSGVQLPHDDLNKVERIIAARDAQWQAKLDDLTRELADAKAGNDYKAWTAERDKLRARIAELENVTVAKPGIDPALLETARAIYAARVAAGTSVGAKSDAVREARALHAELEGKP